MLSLMLVSCSSIEVYSQASCPLLEMFVQVNHLLAFVFFPVRSVYGCTTADGCLYLALVFVC